MKLSQCIVYKKNLMPFSEKSWKSLFYAEVGGRK